MKKIILRKPKWMRNDAGMLAYIKVAESISKVMCKTEMSTDERYDMLMKLNYCFNEAAKAGGFFSTNDFHEWMKLNIN